MNRWYRQLFKRIGEQAELAKLKVSEETFSENYQGDFSVNDAIPDLEVLATIGPKNRAQARLVKISRDPKNYSIKLQLVGFPCWCAIPTRSDRMPINSQPGRELPGPLPACSLFFSATISCG